MDYRDVVAKLLRRKAHFGDLLPWKDVLDVEEGILSTKNDGLMSTVRIWPRDLVTLTKVEQGSLLLRVNDAFKRVTPGCGVWPDAVRQPDLYYPAQVPSCHPVAAVVDDEYRDFMLAEGRRWETAIYLTLYRRASKDVSSSIRKVINYEPHRPTVKGALAGMREFRGEFSRFLDVLGMACDRVERLDGDALATYLHGLISIFEQPVVLPDDGRNLSYRLVDSAYLPGPPATLGVRQYREYILTMTLNYRLPAKVSAAVFQGLYRLPFPFRWCNRWIPLERKKVEKRTEETQINILSSKDSGKAQMFARKKQVTIKKSYADDQARDADAAQNQVLSDEAGGGFLTTTFVVRHPDYYEAERQLQMIESVIRRAGCVVDVDHQNITESFLASMPGHVVANVQRQLEVNTMNLTDLGPFHLPWAGVPWNDHLKAPALTVALTDECMTYHMNTHVGDLADSVSVGPKGSGKSTAEAFKDYCEWVARYEQAQVIGFDVGESWECVTRCLGGAYHNLGRGDASIQLLQGLDDEHEYPFIYQTLVLLLEQAHLKPTPTITTALTAGLDAIRRSSAPRRMISLVEAIRQIKNGIEPLLRTKQDILLKDRFEAYGAILQPLSRFSEGGVFGHLTDAPVDKLTVEPIHTFELETLLSLPDVWPVLLSVIFHRLQHRLNGRPTRLLFGEAWVVFRIPQFMDALADWMPSWRRNNASGDFSTQSISQMAGHRLTPFLDDSCQVRHFYPNPQAMDENPRKGYNGLRLNEEDLQIISRARPKRDVYVVRPEGRRLIDLALSPIALSICGANSKEDHARMNEILDRYGSEDFGYHWLRMNGHEAAARRVDTARQHDDVHATAQVVAADD